MLLPRLSRDIHFLVNNIDSELWLQPGRHPDRNSERACATDRLGQFNRAAIDSNIFNLTQCSRNILARDRTIEAALTANTCLKGKCYLAQALRLLPILLSQFLQPALLGGDTLCAIRNQAGGRPSREVTRQEVVKGITIRDVFQVASFSQAFNIL